MSLINVVGNVPGINSNSNLYFKVSPVPEFPFIHTPFNVTISISDDKGKIPWEVEDLHFSLSLVENSPHPLDGSDYSHLLNLQPHHQYSFDSNGCCRLSLSFCELSAAYDCRKFILLVQSGSVFGVSTPMTSVQYRLQSSSLIQTPIIWFKDRGGKKNCIEVPVRLISSNGENVIGQIVPITVQLIYADGEPVADQYP